MEESKPDVRLVATRYECPLCGGSGFVADSVSARADAETLRDRDQTTNDRDQTYADQDQAASDCDQRSADNDQEASDQDFAGGSDPIIYQRTTLARERSHRDRDAMSRLRVETSGARALSAAERDRSAELRDRGAEGRDRLARLHDQQSDADASREDILLRAERDRARAAADRAKAADDRARAAADRQEAMTLRAAARHNLELAVTDQLTGAWTRKFGLAEVGREIERARRTGGSLVLAFIDVDHLKRVNDTQGHSAGDRLLHLVVETVRANVRSYDVIVRYGGDEFLCAMPNLTRAGAEKRMQKITAALAAASEGCSISFGLAEHEAADGIQELVNRADVGLLEARRIARAAGDGRATPS